MGMNNYRVMLETSYFATTDADRGTDLPSDTGGARKPRGLPSTSWRVVAFVEEKRTRVSTLSEPSEGKDTHAPQKRHMHKQRNKAGKVADKLCEVSSPPTP